MGKLGKAKMGKWENWGNWKLTKLRCGKMGKWGNGETEESVPVACHGIAKCLVVLWGAANSLTVLPYLGAIIQELVLKLSGSRGVGWVGGG